LNEPVRELFTTLLAPSTHLTDTTFLCSLFAAIWIFIQIIQHG
jgi:hypothetical protein